MKGMNVRICKSVCSAKERGTNKPLGCCDLICRTRLLIVIDDDNNNRHNIGTRSCTTKCGRTMLYLSHEKPLTDMHRNASWQQYNKYCRRKVPLAEVPALGT